MKGAVLTRCRDATLVDITHEIEPGQVTRGALALAAAVGHFPVGSIHIAVVDPGVGSARKSLVIDCADYVLVGPDNGLLMLACTPEANAYVLDRSEHYAGDVSATFHGRDVFAPTAGRIAAGATPEELGSRVPLDSLVAVDLPKPRATQTGLVGEVMYADHFGNLVTNLSREDIGALGGTVAVTIAETDIGPLRRTYADAAAGVLIALIGSNDRLEVALVGGSAGNHLSGLTAPGAQVRVERCTG